MCNLVLLEVISVEIFVASYVMKTVIIIIIIIIIIIKCIYIAQNRVMQLIRLSA